MNARRRVSMKGIDAMRGDDNIVHCEVKGCFEYRNGARQERSPKKNQDESRGPDNRTLARKTPGLRSNGCKQSIVACNQSLSRTDIPVCLTATHEDRQ
jgi:hypothetical protein